MSKTQLDADFEKMLNEAIDRRMDEAEERQFRKELSLMDLKSYASADEARYKQGHQARRG